MTRHPPSRSLVGLFAGLGLMLANTVAAQQAPAYTSEPGYLDLPGILGVEDTAVTAEINLRPNILKFVAAAASRENPEFAEAIKDVRFIQVRVFEVEESQYSDLAGTFASLSADLERKGWERIVRVREDGKSVNLHLLPGPDDQLDGFAVLVLEAGEAVIVNVVGRLDLASIARLGEGLDLDVLEDMEDLDEPAS